MTQRWNWKAMLDRVLEEGWSSSSDAAMLARAIRWANEIQDDIVNILPYDQMRFWLKKKLPVQQEYVNLDIDKPAAPTAALGGGGSLTEGSKYKAYVTFVIYDPDEEEYMESEPSPASGEITTTSGNLTVNLTEIPKFEGDDDYNPKIIYRNIYVSKEASGDSAHGPKYFSSQITNNQDTTASITSEPATTEATPPSATEIDQISSDHLYFPSTNTFLTRVDSNRLRRYDPDGSEASDPRNFDFWKMNGIRLYPKLSAAASEAQRTLVYAVHRRPHEAFYNVTRKIDLPIVCETILVKGLLWKIYEFYDRAGKESKQINYMEARKELERKFQRMRQRPSYIRDVVGDYAGFEV